MSMSRKVLGIHGSPCLDGNTAELLEAVLEGARTAGASTERMDIARMSISPCRECRACDSDMTCVQQHDDMNVIYARIREVDAIVLASPIFFMSVTAQTKAVIDRCQCFWVERFVMKKRAYEGRRRPKGLFVSCAGGPKAIVFEPAIHVAKAFFSAIDYEYAGEVLLSHTDSPELGDRKPAVLQRAREAGRTLVQ